MSFSIWRGGGRGGGGGVGSVLRTCLVFRFHFCVFVDIAICHCIWKSHV